MTASWGPAMEAEVAYRHAQIRAQMGHRRRGWFRRTHTSTRTAPVTRAE